MLVPSVLFAKRRLHPYPYFVALELPDSSNPYLVALELPGSSNPCFVALERPDSSNPSSPSPIEQLSLESSPIEQLSLELSSATQPCVAETFVGNPRADRMNDEYRVRAYCVLCTLLSLCHSCSMLWAVAPSLGCRFSPSFM